MFSSEVSLDLTAGRRYFANSEGFRTAVPMQAAAFRAGITLLADDGMPIRDTLTIVARPGALPPKADLLAATRSLLDDLLVTRAAAVGDDYSGPVLLEPDAAATLIAQSFVPLFLARRASDSDDGRGGGPGGGTPFLTRIGNRVLPESFTVKDTPSLTEFERQPVGGAYVVDDEGMRAQDVTLVQDGRLKTLLTTRTPLKNLPRSNGHARGGGPQAGVFQDRKRRGGARGGTEGEAAGIDEGAGAAVRLHHPAAVAGRTRVVRPGHVGGEGDAGRKGGAGPRPGPRAGAAHRVPRHLRRVARAGGRELAAARRNGDPVGGDDVRDCAQPGVRGAGPAEEQGAAAEDADRGVAVCGR